MSNLNGKNEVGNIGDNYKTSNVKWYKGADKVYDRYLKEYPDPYEMQMNDFVLKKGTTISRVTSSLNENYKNSKGIYASFLYEDFDEYSQQAYLLTAGKTPYVYEYQLKKDIKLPSYKARMETFVETIGKDISLKSVNKNQADEYIQKMNSYRKKVVDINSKESMQEIYASFSKDMFETREYKKYRDAFINNLERKGYEATYDDNDAGHTTIAPLFIPNANEVLSKPRVYDLAGNRIKDA